MNLNGPNAASESSRLDRFKEHGLRHADGLALMEGGREADLLLVGEALAEEPHAEAQVIGILYLLPEQLLLAVPGQQSLMLLQALLHSATMLIHSPAVGLGIHLQPCPLPSGSEDRVLHMVWYQPADSFWQHQL